MRVRSRLIGGVVAVVAIVSVCTQVLLCAQSPARAEATASGRAQATPTVVAPAALRRDASGRFVIEFDDIEVGVTAGSAVENYLLSEELARQGKTEEAIRTLQPVLTGSIDWSRGLVVRTAACEVEAAGTAQFMVLAAIHALVCRLLDDLARIPRENEASFARACRAALTVPIRVEESSPPSMMSTATGEVLFAISAEKCEKALRARGLAVQANKLAGIRAAVSKVRAGSVNPKSREFMRAEKVLLGLGEKLSFSAAEQCLLSKELNSIEALVAGHLREEWLNAAKPAERILDH